MTFGELGELAGWGLDRDVQRLMVDELDGESVIFAHNRLKELDDMLHARWVQCGSPNPELLK